ncbi:ketopantoate reductase family protein [Streptomyces chartreusis]|uniref:ketopantoate reductase family protein n=1 Tax=Streptomyces chartreusis TaxID=1969 RepID=UPI003D8AA2C2
MKLLYAGAGAVGGFLAARTSASGHDVTVLVRPARAKRLRAEGLRLSGTVKAVARPAVVTAGQLTGRFDAVIIAVKADALRSLLQDLAPAVGPHTLLVPFLNGMAHMDALTGSFGQAVAGGVLRVATDLDDDGAVRVLNPLFEAEIGELDGGPGSRLEPLAAALRSAGADVTVSRTIIDDMWAKWVSIASVGAITGLLRAPIGMVAATPGGEAFARTIVAEAASVAAEASHPLAAGRLDRLVRMVTAADSPLTSSLSRDVLAGRPTEVEAVLGDLVRRAHAAGIGTPALDAATLALRVHNRSLQRSR